MDLKRQTHRSLFVPEDIAEVVAAIAIGATGLFLSAAATALPWQALPYRALRIFGTALGATLTVESLRRGRHFTELKQLHQIRQDYRREATRRLCEEELRNLLSSPTLTATPPPTPFDWNDLRNSTAFPHIAIEGKTGQGKSTLAEYLCSLLGGTVIAVAPHYEPGDYPSADLIAGVGRDYGKAISSEPLVDWADILAGQVVSVTGLIKSLHKEMTDRYRMADRSDCPPINIILDEFNAYAKKDGVGDLIKELIREARKVKIRLILLCHGTEVKSLGIEGEGSLRYSLTRIRMGNFATEYATTKVNKCRLNTPDYHEWRAIVEALNGSDRPAMVEDNLAKVPYLGDGAIALNPHQIIVGLQPQPQPQPQPATEAATWLERCYSLNCTDVATEPQCPHCGSVDIKKHGRGRHKCKSCNKTWSDKS